MFGFKRRFQLCKVRPPRLKEPSVRAPIGLLYLFPSTVHYSADTLADKLQSCGDELRDCQSLRWSMRSYYVITHYLVDMIRESGHYPFTHTYNLSAGLVQALPGVPSNCDLYKPTRPQNLM